MSEITSQTSGSVSDSDSECLMSKVPLCGMRRKSDSDSDSDSDSGTMDPHSYNKIQMTNNTFFLKAGGNLISVMFSWINTIIQPIEQLVRKLVDDKHNLTDTFEALNPSSINKINNNNNDKSLILVDTVRKTRIPVISPRAKTILQQILDQIVRESDEKYDFSILKDESQVKGSFIQAVVCHYNVMLVMEYDIKGGTIFPHRLPFILFIQRNNWERLPTVHTLVTENFSYKNISVNIFHKIIILKVLNRMFKGFTVDSDASISFGELPVGGHETKEEVGPMNVPPIDEYQSQSLLDNTIFLAKKSEREVDSNLIVVGGLPCSFSLLAIYDVILKIGNLLNHIYTLHIDIMALELFLRASDRDQITLYSDGRTCSFTLDLPNVKKFAMGGHMFFPAAFGYCSTPHIPFDFTCQAMPVPASLLSLKC